MSITRILQITEAREVDDKGKECLVYAGVLNTFNDAGDQTKSEEVDGKHFASAFPSEKEVEKAEKKAEADAEKKQKADEKADAKAGKAKAKGGAKGLPSDLRPVAIVGDNVTVDGAPGKITAVDDDGVATTIKLADGSEVSNVVYLYADPAKAQADATWQASKR